METKFAVSKFLCLKLIFFKSVFINRDRVLLANQVERNKILDGNYSYLQDLCSKLKELKDNLEVRMESNLTDAQKEHDLNKQKIMELQDLIRQMTKERESYEEKLTNSELVLQEIQGEFDNLSLRTKIVTFLTHFYFIWQVLSTKKQKLCLTLLNFKFLYYLYII